MMKSRYVMGSFIGPEAEVCSGLSPLRQEIPVYCLKVASDLFVYIFRNNLYHSEPSSRLAPRNWKRAFTKLRKNKTSKVYYSTVRKVNGYVLGDRGAIPGSGMEFSFRRLCTTSRQNLASSWLPRRRNFPACKEAGAWTSYLIFIVPRLRKWPPYVIVMWGLIKHRVFYNTCSSICKNRCVRWSLDYN
jgi:hypothetical protein